MNCPFCSTKFRGVITEGEVHLGNGARLACDVPLPRKLDREQRPWPLALAARIDRRR